MHTQVARSDILEAMEIAGMADDQLHERYSGRNMYGGDCLGITYDSLGDVLCFVVELSRIIGVEIDAFYGIATDSMGRSSIAYWPSVSLDEEDFEDPDPDRREV